MSAKSWVIVAGSTILIASLQIGIAKRASCDGSADAEVMPCWLHGESIGFRCGTKAGW